MPLTTVPTQLAGMCTLTALSCSLHPLTVLVALTTQALGAQLADAGIGIKPAYCFTDVAAAWTRASHQLLRLRRARLAGLGCPALPRGEGRGRATGCPASTSGARACCLPTALTPPPLTSRWSRRTRTTSASVMGRPRSHRPSTPCAPSWRRTGRRGESGAGSEGGGAACCHTHSWSLLA